MDDVEVRPAVGKGLGVFARKRFLPGDVILRFSGRRVSRADLPRLTSWEWEHLGEVDIDIWQVLPEPACYLNHACSPNAVHTSSEVYAMREIVPGEEITIDYRLNAYDDGDIWEMRCECGSPGGSHVVRGDFFSLSEEGQLRYLPFAPAFIQRMYRLRHGGGD